MSDRNSAIDSFELACSACLPGSYVVDAALQCVLCEAGFEQPLAGQSNCRFYSFSFSPCFYLIDFLSACPRGAVAPRRGTLMCMSCPRGLFVESPALTCRPCPTGFFSNVSGSLDCAACQLQDMCPLASAFGVPRSVIPYFNSLNRAFVSSPVQAVYNTDFSLVISGLLRQVSSFWRWFWGRLWQLWLWRCLSVYCIAKRRPG